MSKKKLLYVAPHLSTGGQPQYLYKQVKEFIKDFEIEVVEINNSGGTAFVVQKNRIKSLVPIHTLAEDKSEIINIINEFNPDIIHFQEIPQFDLDNKILDRIFSDKRKYFIVASTHGSFTNPSEIVYHPDRYILVSEWSRQRFIETGVETDVWQYPIEDYVFDLVDKQGLYVRTGNFNISQNNTYLNVGRDGGSSVVVEPVIEFYRTADTNGIGDAGHIDMDNNKSINDYFQRTAELTVDPLYFSQDYFPEVHGSKRIELSQPVRTSVGVKLIAETAIRLPSDQQRGVIALAYTYRAEDSDGPILQSGVLTVTYNRNNAEITLSDEHTFTGNPSKVGKLVFSVKGSAFQNGGTEIHLDIVNEMLDNLSPETDELEFTIKYIN